MMNKKIVFISSKQTELQSERDKLRDFINSKDDILSKLFVAKTFEVDLTGRSESVKQMTEEWVLKSDIYLGIFDKEYSEATEFEYETAVKDIQVKKEIIIFIRKREKEQREDKLIKFLNRLMNSEEGHSCIFFDNLEDLLNKVKQSLLNYYRRKIEGFIISKELLGPNLQGAKNTDFPEKFRRKLLQPLGRFIVKRGRKGFPEYYTYDWDGTKIDVTWDYIEPNAPDEIKEYYKKRYGKPFDK